MKKAWAAWARAVANPGFECDGSFYMKMSGPEAVAGIRADLLQNYVQLLTDTTQKGGLTSVNHGDPSAPYHRHQPWHYLAMSLLAFAQL